MSRIALALALLLIGLGACKRGEPAQEGAPAVQPEAPVKGVDRSHKGAPMPALSVLGADGRQRPLAALHDRPLLLVNLWASWCAPCVKELPALQALAGRNRPDLRVLPISQDVGPQSSVEAFLASRHVDFAPLQDPDMALSGALGAEVLPTTILYGPDGRELWRYVGGLDWTGPEASRLLAEAPAVGRSGVSRAAAR